MAPKGSVAPPMTEATSINASSEPNNGTIDPTNANPRQPSIALAPSPSATGFLFQPHYLQNNATNDEGSLVSTGSINAGATNPVDIAPDPVVPHQIPVLGEIVMDEEKGLLAQGTVNSAWTHSEVPPASNAQEEKNEVAPHPTASLGNSTTAKSVKRILSRKETIAYAKAMSKSTHLGGGKSFFKTSMKDVAELGVGLQLYFLFTKYMGICFLCMSVIATPALIMHGTSNGIDSTMIDPLKLGLFTIANEGLNSSFVNSNGNNNATSSTTFNATEWTKNNPLTTNVNYISYIITACDVLYSLVFVGFIVLFKVKIRTVLARQTEVITPAKYAVFVRGLPKHATAQGILDHFNHERYDPTKTRLEYPHYLGFLGKPKKPKVASEAYLTLGGQASRPVQTIDHLDIGSSSYDDTDGGDPIAEKYKGTHIAQVSVAYASGGLLRYFLELENLTGKQARLQDVLSHMIKEKKLKTKDSDITKQDKKIARIEKQLARVKVALAKETEKMNAALKVNNAADHDGSPACEGAFVMFNSVEAQRRCLRDYRTSHMWYCRYFQPKSLRYEGTYALKVVQAPVRLL